MKKLYFFLTFLALCSFAFTGCNNDDDDPQPTTGSIKANVSPAGAATNMRLTQGSTTLEIAPNSSGSFQADNLQPGDYAVTFTAAVGFQGPASRNVTITAGNTSDLGTVTFTRPGSQFIGTMTASVNGSAWNSAIHAATVSGTGLSITGSSISMTGSAEAIILNLPNASGTGTFNAPLDASGIYTMASLTGGGTPLNWGSGGPFANCTVTISQFDTVSNKISGTFSFVAFPAPGTPASGIKTISNGSFTNLNIQ